MSEAGFAAAPVADEVAVAITATHAVVVRRRGAAYDVLERCASPCYCRHLSVGTLAEAEACAMAMIGPGYRARAGLPPVRRYVRRVPKHGRDFRIVSDPEGRIVTDMRGRAQMTCHDNAYFRDVSAALHHMSHTPGELRASYRSPRGAPLFSTRPPLRLRRLAVTAAVVAAPVVLLACGVSVDAVVTTFLFAVLAPAVAIPTFYLGMLAGMNFADYRTRKVLSVAGDIATLGPVAGTVAIFLGCMVAAIVVVVGGSAFYWPLVAVVVSALWIVAVLGVTFALRECLV